MTPHQFHVIIINKGAYKSNEKENFCTKITEGKKAQITSDFMIIARIESLILNKGIKDAIERAKSYIDSGADGLMIHSKEKSEEEIVEFCSLFNRFKNKNIAVIDSILLDKPKTKDAAAMLKKLSLPNKTLFIISEKNRNFQLAVRNLPYVNVLLVDGLNVFDLLKHEKIVCTKDALQRIEERLN